jgi:hypothetical protein
VNRQERVVFDPEVSAEDHIVITFDRDFGESAFRSPGAKL